MNKLPHIDIALHSSIVLALQLQNCRLKSIYFLEITKIIGFTAGDKVSLCRVLRRVQQWRTLREWRDLGSRKWSNHTQPQLPFLLWQRHQGCHAIGQAQCCAQMASKSSTAVSQRFPWEGAWFLLCLPGCPRLCTHLSLKMTDFSVFATYNVKRPQRRWGSVELWIGFSTATRKANFWHLNDFKWEQDVFVMK